MKEETNQVDSQGRCHGVWEEHHQDGTLWWKFHYHHGTPHGVWEWYREDGTPSYREYNLNIK